MRMGSLPLLIVGITARTLVDLTQEPGQYTVPLAMRAEGERPLSPGIYLVRISAGGHEAVERVIALE